MEDAKKLYIGLALGAVFAFGVAVAAKALTSQEKKSPKEQALTKTFGPSFVHTPE